MLMISRWNLEKIIDKIQPTMLGVHFISHLIALCLIAGQTILVVKVCGDDFKNCDVFQALDIDAHDLGRRVLLREVRKRRQSFVRVFEDESPVDRLNNLLIDSTDSVDPETNFDVVLEELIKFYKNNGEFVSRESQVKRLFLALQTLQGDHLCDYYGFMITQNNKRAIRTKARQIMNNEGLRRVDKILAHFIRERVNKCMPVYLRNFDKILPTLNQTLMKRLDRLLGRLIEDVRGPDSKITLDESDSEKFYHLVKGTVQHPNLITTAEIYNVMKDLAKDDEDARYLQPVENERTGVIGINKEKFDKLYDEYVAKPCKHYKEQLGPDVFEPLHFDTYYGHEIQKDRPDFYEAYYKYSLCENKLVYPEQRALVAEYANGKKFVH